METLITLALATIIAILADLWHARAVAAQLEAAREQRWRRDEVRRMLGE